MAIESESRDAALFANTEVWQVDTTFVASIICHARRTAEGLIEVVSPRPRWLNPKARAQFVPRALAGRQLLKK